MKRIHITNAVVICLMLACNSQRKSDHYETYKELAEEREAIMLDSTATSDKFLESEAKYRAFAESFSESEIQNFLSLELSDIMSNPGNPVGPSAPERGEQQPPGVRSCASDDRADSLTLKTFRTPKLFFSAVFPRVYHIRLAVHIIEDPAVGQVVSELELNEQIRRLNEAYSPIKLVFEIQSLTRNQNHNWYNASPVDSNLTHFNRMVQTLNADPSRFINVYINGMSDWGYGSFPWEAEYQTPYDCVVIKDVTLPNKILDDHCQPVVMMGKTLIHEMGHFLGLFHTFHSDQRDDQGRSLPCNSDSYDGCSDGDEVDDTPPQRYCHFYGCGECHTGRGCCSLAQPCDGTCDTCPTDGTPDEVNNYMGYNPDACMDHFTKGQYDRMEIWFFAKRRYAVKG